MTQAAPPPSRLLLLVIGFAIWSAAFVALYAINAIGCAFGWDAGVQRAVLVGLLAAHTALLIWCVFATLGYLRAAESETGRMLAYAGLGLTVAALASTLFVFAPSLFASMCV